MVAEEINDAIIEQEGKTASELSELKVALEQSQGQAKLAKVQLEAALNKQKVQAAKELKDVRVALERSQEQAKVSLHDDWWWIDIFSSLLSFFILFLAFKGLKRLKTTLVDFFPYH